MPTTSSTVSPLSRNAVRKAPSCDGVASPSMISVITAAASASPRSLPAVSVAIASRIISSGLKNAHLRLVTARGDCQLGFAERPPRRHPNTTYYPIIIKDELDRRALARPLDLRF